MDAGGLYQEAYSERLLMSGAQRNDRDQPAYPRAPLLSDYGRRTGPADASRVDGRLTRDPVHRPAFPPVWRCFSPRAMSIFKSSLVPSPITLRAASR